MYSSRLVDPKNLGMDITSDSKDPQMTKLCPCEISREMAAILVLSAAPISVDFWYVVRDVQLGTKPPKNKILRFFKSLVIMELNWLHYRHDLISVFRICKLQIPPTCFRLLIFTSKHRSNALFLMFNQAIWYTAWIKNVQRLWRQLNFLSDEKQQGEFIAATSKICRWNKMAIFSAFCLEGKIDLTKPVWWIEKSKRDTDSGISFQVH